MALKQLFSSLLLLFILNVSLSAQQFNERVVDPESGEEYLVGYCTLEGILESDFIAHYDKEYEAYEINMDEVDIIHAMLTDIKITIVMAQWCGDSHREVPRFMKIIDHAGFPPEMLTFICVDKNKDAGNADISELDIKKVPAFIFYFQEQEMGRIVESPYDTMEKDIIKTLKSGKDSIHD